MATRKPCIAIQGCVQWFLLSSVLVLASLTALKANERKGLLALTPQRCSSVSTPTGERHTTRQFSRQSRLHRKLGVIGFPKSTGNMRRQIGSSHRLGPRASAAEAPTSAVDAKRVLIASDNLGDLGSASVMAANYLAMEFYTKGHEVVMVAFGDANATLERLPSENRKNHASRKEATLFFNVDTNSTASLGEQFVEGGAPTSFDIVIDMSNVAAQTKQILELQQVQEAEQVVYISSDLVYGPYLNGPCSEQRPTNPCTESADEKAEGEAAVMVQQNEVREEESGRPWTIIRPGRIIAPGSEKSLENWFFLRHDKEKQICIPGHGQYLLGVVHIAGVENVNVAVGGGDLISGVMAAVGSSNAIGQVFNMHSNDPISFDGLALETARIFEREVESDDLVHYDESQFTWVLRRRHQFPVKPIGHVIPTVDKAKTLLDWSPRYNTSEALRNSHKMHYNEMSIEDELPELDYELDEMILENPHKQLQIAWSYPHINFNRPLGAEDADVADTGNKWDWE
eukprot:jgi/Bigna1/66432/fgenesh1_pg.1_\